MPIGGSSLIFLSDKRKEPSATITTSSNQEEKEQELVQEAFNVVADHEDYMQCHRDDLREWVPIAVKSDGM